MAPELLANVRAGPRHGFLEMSFPKIDELAAGLEIMPVSAAAGLARVVSHFSTEENAVLPLRGEGFAIRASCKGASGGTVGRAASDRPCWSNLLQALSCIIPHRTTVAG